MILQIWKHVAKLDAVRPLETYSVRCVIVLLSYSYQVLVLKQRGYDMNEIIFLDSPLKQHFPVSGTEGRNEIIKTRQILHSQNNLFQENNTFTIYITVGSDVNLKKKKNV